MRAVLVGIDYVKDTDGSFKVLELNTNVAIPNIDGTIYFETDSFKSFLTENGIQDVHLIISQNAVLAGYYRDLDKIGVKPPVWIAQLGISCDDVGVTFQSHLLKTNEGIPNIEDSPTTLIIRQSYDSTALIDDSYARDNFQFLKLLHDSNPNSIPKTCFVHNQYGFDSVDSIRDNGIHPNFIIKKRYPSTNYNEYPKLYKITTQEELTSLKDSLSVDDILQEFIFNGNDLLEGKMKTYRSVDCFYGELDILNLLHPFEHTNPLIITEVTDYSNNQVQVWDRPKYLQKSINSGCDGTLKRYIADDTTKVLKIDNTLIDAEDLVIGDTLKTVSIPTLPDSDSGNTYLKWSGDTQTVLSETSISATTVQNIETQIQNLWIKTLTLSNGSSFSDVKDATILVNQSGVTKFKKYIHVALGDEVIYYNNTTDSIETATITNIGYSYTRENVYLLDVEDIDVYMVSEEGVTSPSSFLIQHNGACESYVFIINGGCQLLGAEWGEVPGMPDDADFCFYVWFCGVPCGPDLPAYGNSCECKAYMQATYGMNDPQSCRACRFICCEVMVESCYIITSPDHNDCDGSTQVQIEPPCGCEATPLWDCTLPKGGYPDPGAIPVP